MDESVECGAADGCSDGESVSLSVLNWEQVQRLDTILTGSIPIHGRWSFPTLEVKPRDIVKVVRSRMEEKRIHVREVRLNGSAASYVLHEDSGLGWKDLDLIFCAELKGEMEFQIVKDIVLDSLLDFLPEGVNKEKITPVTLKVTFYRINIFAKQNLHFVSNFPSHLSCPHASLRTERCTTVHSPLDPHTFCLQMHFKLNAH